MKPCYLIVDASLLPALQGSEVCIYWESSTNTHGYSLPLFLQEHLPVIRSRHAAWAYQMGQKEMLGKTLARHLQLDEGPSFWYTSLLYERHPKMTPSLYPIYKLFALEEILSKEGPSSLTLVGIEEPLREVVGELCCRMQIPFTSLGKKPKQQQKLSLQTIYTHLPGIVRGALRFVHWLFTIKRLVPRAHLDATKTKTATIVTYFPNIDMQKAQQGRFISRYWEKLHTLINTKAQQEGQHFVRWLFIRFPAKQLSFQDCLSFCARLEKEKKDGCSFHYLEGYLSNGDLLRCFCIYLRMMFVSMLLERHFANHSTLKGSKLNFWPYIKKDYVESFRGWRGLERILQNRAMHTYVRSAGPQRFFLFPLENCPWERMLTHAVHAFHAGPIYGAQHSSLRPTDLRYFDAPEAYTAQNTVLPLPTLYLSNGSSAQKQWRASGMPREKERMVSALRYLYLPSMAKTLAQTPVKKGPPTLLLLTSFFADETKAHLELFVAAYRQNLFGEYHICIKPHPYLPITAYLPKDIDVEIGEGPLAKYFVPPVLVWASNSTTAALEAAYLGLPCAVMRPVNDFDLSPIQDLPTITRTATLRDVQEMLKKANQAPQIATDYLFLEEDLSSWRKVLGL